MKDDGWKPCPVCFGNVPPGYENICPKCGGCEWVPGDEKEEPRKATPDEQAPMKLFRPRDVTVEAMKVSTGPGSEAFPASWGVYFTYNSLLKAVEVFRHGESTPLTWVNVGDWIFRDTVTGAFKTMDDEMFKATFEAVEMNL